LKIKIELIIFIRRFNIINMTNLSQFVLYSSFAMLIILASSCKDPEVDPREAWVGEWRGTGTWDATYPACYAAQVGGLTSFSAPANFSVMIEASPTTANQVLLGLKAINTNATGYYCTCWFGPADTFGNVTTGIFNTYEFGNFTTWSFNKVVLDKGMLKISGTVTVKNSYCQPGNVSILQTHYFVAQLSRL